MRLLLVFALVGLTAAAPVRDWSTVVRADADGGYVIGDPAAPVKLVEYASYTCPHCAHFMTESAGVLKARMIRSGSTSLAVRHLIRDPLDLVAVVVARCGGTRGFAARHAAIFAGQDAWMDTGAAYLRANGERLGKLAKPLAFRQIADGAGLTAIGRAHGVTAKMAAACFTGPAIERVAALNEQVPAAVQGTPTFYIDGKIVPDVATWAGLEPVLRAHGAK